jgi:Flp pilus assembly protein TadG
LATSNIALVGAMLDAIRNKFAVRMRWLMPRRVARRFVHQQDGTAAVEFAMVAVPFLALIFAILETSLFLFANQILEGAVSDAGRLIMTGQAQTAGFSQTAFLNAVCARLSGMFNCNAITMNVQTFSNFTSISTPPPITNGKLDNTKVGYNPGTAGSIVAVALYYQWPIYVSLLDQLANFGGGRLMVATSVFRVEPYQ